MWGVSTSLGVNEVVVHRGNVGVGGKGGEEVGIGKMCGLVIWRMFGWSRGWLVASEEGRW